MRDLHIFRHTYAFTYSKRNFARKKLILLRKKKNQNNNLLLCLIYTFHGKYILE